ncbi:MAG: sulfoxide reductase heme-binding subunit YedZ [Ectothiorhodospiraceae bacterium]|nr:sulfoxide reductase heme-binding subunit YedZ [Ectothiorhodospiraceae bacterium]
MSPAARVRALKLTTFAAAGAPLVALTAAALGGGLGANPVETITHETGEWGLRLLLATLAVTPLRRLTGWQLLGRVRRMLGLWSFFYVGVHFATYAVLDAGLDLGFIVEDIVKRPYITVGFATLVMLVPLAVTSTDGAVRRLGGRRWRALHRLAYLAGVGGVVHFLWLVKADLLEPLVYLVVLTGLLAARIPAVSSALGRWRATPARRPDQGRARATLAPRGSEGV